MRDHEEATHLVQLLAQLFRAADARQVRGETDREHVAHIGRDLHAEVDEEVRVLRAETGLDMAFDDLVMLGHVDAAEPILAGDADEVVGVEHAVGGRHQGVDVHLDDRGLQSVAQVQSAAPWSMSWGVRGWAQDRRAPAERPAPEPKLARQQRQ